jgi:hypothetical protein
MTRSRACVVCRVRFDQEGGVYNRCVLSVCGTGQGVSDEQGIFRQTEAERSDLLYVFRKVS